MKISVSDKWRDKLLAWFEKNKRSLPWRRTKDPYSIWISEVMLQQTTSKAVIPYYKKFIKKFPNLSALAAANQKELFSLWSGLGYYTRAENLLKAANQLKEKRHFPRTYKELLKLPGFGAYTARAVSSLAFEEPAGVLDGNVIRFLSRFHGRPLRPWRSRERAALQELSDLWAQKRKASRVNQALMEIGSVICRAKNPLCRLCPLSAGCRAYKKGLTESLPLKRPRRPVEFWRYSPEKIQKNSRWAFIKNKSMPFLKGRFVFPGRAEKASCADESCDFVHSIMHYQIFVRVKNKKKAPGRKDFKWLSKTEIQTQNPSSLIKKILSF